MNIIVNIKSLSPRPLTKRYLETGLADGTITFVEGIVNNAKTPGLFLRDSKEPAYGFLVAVYDFYGNARECGQEPKWEIWKGETKEPGGSWSKAAVNLIHEIAKEFCEKANTEAENE